MAYVPGYKHDILVSYASVDNEPVPGVEKGWVSSFVRSLEVCLSQELGRRESEAFEIWWDRSDLDETKPLEDQIGSTLRKTAILVVVLSRAYVKSDWCAKERVYFRDAVQDGPLAAERAFLVDIGNLEMDQRPDEFADYVPFRFWQLDDERKKRRRLGYPTPDPKRHPEYYDLVMDVAVRIGERLEDIKNATKGDVAEPHDSAEAELVATPDANGKPTVFLAETSDDLEFKRAEVVRYLEQHKLAVVPVHTYPSDEETCKVAIDNHLRQSAVFAQLLGPFPGRKLGDSAQRLVNLQLELASNAGLPILQWRDARLDLEQIADAAHLELLTGNNVIADQLETFKSEILKAATPQPAVQSSRPSADNGSHMPFVFVNAGVEDREMADVLKAQLENLNCMAATPLDDGDPTEIREDLEANVSDCDALILMYGRISRTWIREQLRRLRRTLGHKRCPLAVCVVPPKEKPEVSVSFPGLQFINCADGLSENALSEFVQLLRTEAAL